MLNESRIYSEARKELLRYIITERDAKVAKYTPLPKPSFCNVPAWAKTSPQMYIQWMKQRGF